MSVRRVAKDVLKGPVSSIAPVTVQDLVRGKLPALALMGVCERDDARADGVSSFYIDSAASDMMLEEKADGAKVRTPLHPVEVPRDFGSERVRSGLAAP
ncbi:hypothetical protein [Pararhizobium sp.]|uniref:hypothetical protein n=1 Tax=Pararhizobium sp. TaxID=1977563 RepID=UPI0027242603|nr:hypothetical protein [Pararhizobium sp.]MDO9418980.1 hypothetical protein [Pararhizobium sp.]